MGRNNRYPCIDEHHKRPYTTPHETGKARDGRCECCDQVAVGAVDVRWGPMRGSDIGCYNVCNRHLTMSKDYAQFAKFISHLRTKSKFMARKASSVSETTPSLNTTDSAASSPDADQQAP